jgi:uncharacterized protein YtpQ (UPF0354 family)
MFSKLRNFFSKNGTDSDREFQDRVCSILAESFPETKPVASDDPLIVEVGKLKIGLSNIRANFNASNRSDEDLRNIVEAYVAALVETEGQLEAETPSWDAAAPILMPQLVNPDRFGDISVLSIPFCADVRIAFVLDSERTFRYVADEMFEAWDVNIKEVLDRAVANLELRSADLAATVVPENLFAVRTMDSFDAARVLSPKIREVIAETVGSPFCFGVPNRDFLVCWPKNAEMSAVWGTQVKIDSQEQPYPISGNIFECDEHGEIAVITAT